MDGLEHRELSLRSYDAHLNTENYLQDRTFSKAENYLLDRELSLRSYDVHLNTKKIISKSELLLRQRTITKTENYL